ncbi:MAG: TetR/AcrR family transcriptional regulator [Rikenellaceae bacterium]
MDARDRVILASITLMNKTGVRKMTMDSVANHLSMSKRTIYEIFENKTELIRSVTKYLIKNSQDTFIEIEKSCTDTVDGMLMMLSKVESEFSKHARINSEVKRYYPEIFEEEFKTHYENTYKLIHNGLKRSAEKGDIISTINIDFAVYTIMETVATLMQNEDRMFTATNVSAVEAFKNVVVYFLRGISTQQGIIKMDKHIIIK